MKKLIMAITLAALLPIVTSTAAQSRVDLVQQLVTDKAHEFNVPTQLAHAVIETESGYNPKALNQGNFGVGQIRCGTARSLGMTGPCRQLLDAEINLIYSMQYLRKALDTAADDWCWAATLYNQGLDAHPRKSRYCTLVLSKIPQ